MKEKNLLYFSFLIVSGKKREKVARYTGEDFKTNKATSHDMRKINIVLELNFRNYI